MDQERPTCPGKRQQKSTLFEVRSDIFQPILSGATTAGQDVCCIVDPGVERSAHAGHRPGGVVSFLYHFSDPFSRPFPHETILVEFVRFLSVLLPPSLMLRGFNRTSRSIPQNTLARSLVRPARALQIAGLEFGTLTPAGRDWLRTVVPYGASALSSAAFSVLFLTHDRYASEGAVTMVDGRVR